MAPHGFIIIRVYEHGLQDIDISCFTWSAKFLKYWTYRLFNFSLEILIAIQEGDKSFQSKHFSIFPAPKASFKHKIAWICSQGLTLQHYTPKHMLAKPSTVGFVVKVFYLLCCKIWKSELIFLHNSIHMKLNRNKLWNYFFYPVVRFFCFSEKISFFIFSRFFYSWFSFFIEFSNVVLDKFFPFWISKQSQK